MLRCATCHRRIGSVPCPHDGWTLPSVAVRLEPAGGAPPRVRGLTVGAPIGAGGFAVVWAAERDGGGPPVTIKVGRSDDPVLVERFAHEADAMERIGPPHAARLDERGRLETGHPYLVMERLFGETLGETLSALPRPPDLGWITQVADAVLASLEATHACGVIHRDLKPDNIFFADACRRAVLLDFGLARRLDVNQPELTRSGVVVGTPEYMAPEQIRGDREIGVQADLYAAGVLLFELLTLRLPFVGEIGAIEHGHLALRPPRPSDLAPVPDALEALVLACLAKEPERRPPSAAWLRRALAEASAEPAPASRPRSARGSRLIAEARCPVAIVVIETGGDAAPVMAAVTGRGGFVARQRGRRYVAVFSGLDAEDPARAAVAAAQELASAHGARAALHLASVTIRRKDGGAPTAYGAPLDRPETWMPAEPWSGVELTAELARALPTGEAGPTVAASAERTLDLQTLERSSDNRVDVPLLGREALVESLAASARVALEEGRPALFTIVGESGLGKSRLAVEAASRVARAHPGVRVVSLCAHAAAGAASLEEDLRRALGAPEGRDTGRASELLARTPIGRSAAADATDRHERIRTLAGALRARSLAGPVAVILDDAHWAEGHVVDALEVATLDDAGGPLWVLVTAHPRFEHTRPSWGARTRQQDRVELTPLEEPAAKELAAELLKPAEYPPAAVLERLAQWSSGNPFSLVELVRALKHAGIVRRRPNTESFYVATADLEALPPSPAWQWLATRRLGALSPELAAALRLCAVLGVTLAREELEWVADAVERAGGAGTPVDAGFALRALVDEGLLERGAGDRYAFRNALFQDAIYEGLDPAQRVEVHRRALAYWQTKAAAPWADAAGGTAPAPGPRLEGPRVDVLGALARHAAACEERDQAADAHLQLGKLAFARHRHVEADQRYSAALAVAPPDDAPRRAAALGGRGSCRYRIGREREAHEDLTAAGELAVALGDRRLVAELLLEEATALDWAREFDASARRVEQARTIIEALRDPALEVRLLVAQGRTAWRQERVMDSIDILQRAKAAARAQDDYESRVIALLILAFELAAVARLEEAEASFAEVISVTTEAKDWLHLISAYVNRAVLWVARKELARGTEDLQQAVTLSREIGNPLTERVAATSAAELLNRSGQRAEALTLARRVCMLEQRFFERPTAMGLLLLARMLISLDDFDEASRVMEQIVRSRPADLSEASELAISLRAFFGMLQLILAEIEHGTAEVPEIPGGWDEVISEAERGVDVDDLLELLYWRARMALRGGRRVEVIEVLKKSESLRDRSAVWKLRFDELVDPSAAAAAAGR